MLARDMSLRASGDLRVQDCSPGLRNATAPFISTSNDSMAGEGFGRVSLMHAARHAAHELP